LLNAPAGTITFVSNATEGINTVLRNLVWNDDGKDVIISFNTIYDAMARAEDFIADYHKGKVSLHEIQLQYPLEDDDIVAIFHDAVKKLEADGKRARLCLFDIVSSNPGVLFPWEQMIKACHEHNVLSLVDGAQGIGMVPIDLTANEPDFLVTNCHKWLFSPRGCAVFHVPERNQKLIPSSLATARGYIPKSRDADRTQPMPDGGGKNHFVRNFEWVGTKDDSPYMCVGDAITWRRDLGGEKKIMDYLCDLNKKGIKLVADRLKTDYLDNKSGTLTNCGMGNVALPLWVSPPTKEVPEGHVLLSSEDVQKVFNFMNKAMMEQYNTFMSIWVRWGRIWVRLSAQVYLDESDYEYGAKVLKELCERVAKQEYKLDEPLPRPS
jgi:selenocysteine lyase/cysteine desulfurase